MIVETLGFVCHPRNKDTILSLDVKEMSKAFLELKTLTLVWRFLQVLVWQTVNPTSTQIRNRPRMTARLRIRLLV